MHEELSEGGLLRIRGPRNNFPLNETAPHVIFLAGGIGITPILAMSHRLLSLGRSFELHYCVRSRARAAFLSLIEGGALREKAVLYCDDAPTRPPLDLDTVLGPSDRTSHAYICGPAGFINRACGAARSNGWDDARIHVERFAAQVDPAAETFTVLAQRSGLHVTVLPDETIVAALRAAGVAVDTSCEAGVCGTCLTPVLEGTPDHRDHYQTNEEQASNRMIAICCSRARSEHLVLDL